MTPFAASLFAVLVAVSANAQTPPAADPHAGHAMPATAPQAAPAADPHAGHNMPTAVPRTVPAADTHAGHHMSSMPGTAQSPMAAVPSSTGTALKASSPAGSAMLNGSPAELSMTLPHSMVLQAVKLTNSAGQRIPLSATLSDQPVETFVTPLPTLPSGVYTVAWTADATDHTMTGTFAFMVH